MNAYAWFNMSFVSCKQFAQSMIQKFKVSKIFCFKKKYIILTKATFIKNTDEQYHWKILYYLNELFFI